jgi:hypothetical protein
LDPAVVGFVGAGRGVCLVSARPGRNNIKGENVGVAAMPPHPAPMTSTITAIAKDLIIEPTLTATIIWASAALATNYYCRGKPYMPAS